jgi:hypothetical protein
MKSILKLSTLFTFLVFFNSCSNDDKSFNNMEMELITSKTSDNYEPIGIIHNEGLDFFLERNSIEDLISKWDNEELDSLALAQFVLSEVNLFLEGNSFELNGDTIYFNEIELEEYLTVYNNPQLGVFSGAIDYIDDKDATVNYINSIMDEYKANPDSEDYEKVLATGELFKYSLQYWNDFHPEVNTEDDCGDFNWLAVGMSDAQGAWSGFGLGGLWGSAAFGLTMSAHNMVIQAIWNCSSK